MENFKTVALVLAFVATISSLTYLVFSAGNDKWIECKPEYDDTKDSSANKYCCKSGTNSWDDDYSKCLPTFNAVNHFIGDSIVAGDNPEAGQQVTFKAEATDDETSITEIKILIDENNDGNFNDETKTCPSSPCSLSKSYSTAGQVVRYYAYATDNAGKTDPPTSPKSLDGACGIDKCYKDTSDDIKSFTVKEKGCTNANTTVTINPTEKSGQAGGELEYDVKVKNNDVECPKGTFTLTSECPASPSGWTCSFDTSPKTLDIDAGLSSTAKIKVKSPSGTSDGNYQFKVIASRKTYTDEESAVYKVTRPSLVLSLTSSNKQVTSFPASNTVSANVKDQGSIAISSTVDVTKITAPTGSNVACDDSTTTKCSQTCATDTNGNCNIDISADKEGTYTVTAKATKSGYTDSQPASTSYIVSTKLGTFTGTVKDASTNLPISGAIVTLSTQTQPIFRQATTDNLGKYTVTLEAGTYSAIASATGYDPLTSVDVTITAGQTTTKDFTLTKIPPIPVQQCTYSLSMKNLPKTNTYQCTSLPCFSEWAITLQDKSSSSCSSPNAYTVSDVTIDPKCDPNTDIYDYGKAPTNKWNRLSSVSVTRNGESNAFTVFARAKGFNSCSVTLNFKDPTGKIADPSFTVIPAGISNQAPHVGFFDFSGDTSTFTAKWEVLYPDNNPKREMKVKCGLNCDPDLQDCSAIAGKGCLPYDASQGTEEIKKGSCSVSSPAYDFSTTNKIICLFYDPADTNLKTRSNHDFTPVDFDARTTGKIVTTVGKAAELKIDVTNKGLVPDSYKITITPPSTADVSPATITTDKIGSGRIVSAFASVTPLVDADGEVEVTVQSLTSSQTKSLKVQLQPGLYALPEFGLVGFLQIIVIAAIVYFLLIQRKVNLKRRRRR